MSDPRARPVIAAVIDATVAPEGTVNEYSHDWRIVAAHCHARIAEAQQELETPGMPLEATEHLRGELKALRAVLALADPNRTPAHVEAESRPYV